MKPSLSSKRAEARRLYLSGEMTTNAEIAAKLKIKPHTIGEWRRGEDWDGLLRKADKRAAEMFVEKIASDRVTLNVRHYRFWDLLVAQMAEQLKEAKTLDVRNLERIATILERAQKGQRLAKGLSVAGETEEQIRAQAESENRRLIDTFIDAVKDNVPDEETRDRIRRAVIEGIPDDSESDEGDPWQ